MSTPCASARCPTSGLNSCSSPSALRVPSGKMSTVLPLLDHLARLADRLPQRRLAVDGLEVRQVLEEGALEAAPRRSSPAPRARRCPRRSVPSACRTKPHVEVARVVRRRRSCCGCAGCARARRRAASSRRRRRRPATLPMSALPTSCTGSGRTMAAPRAPRPRRGAPARLGARRRLDEVLDVGHRHARLQALRVDGAEARLERLEQLGQHAASRSPGRRGASRAASRPRARRPADAPR